MPMPSIDSANWPSNWTRTTTTTRLAGLQAGKDRLRHPPGHGRLRSGQTDLDPKSQCKPATFCEVKNGGACGCSLTASDPLALADPVRTDCHGHKGVFGGILGACEKACSQWAVKDLDFPGKGPLGFSFKMRRLDPDDKGCLHRPAPKPFPTTKDRIRGQPDPDWLTIFTNTAIEPDHSKGDCHYAELPTNGPGVARFPERVIAGRG